MVNEESSHNPQTEPDLSALNFDSAVVATRRLVRLYGVEAMRTALDVVEGEARAEAMGDKVIAMIGGEDHQRVFGRKRAS